MKHQLSILSSALVPCFFLLLLVSPGANAGSLLPNSCVTGVDSNGSPNTQTAIGPTTVTTTWQCTYPFVYGADYDASARFQCVPINSGVRGAPLAPIGMQFAGQSYVAYNGSNPMEVRRNAKSGEVFLDGVGMGMIIGGFLIAAPAGGSVAGSAVGFTGSVIVGGTKDIFAKQTINLTVYCKQVNNITAQPSVPVLTPQQQKGVDEEEYQEGQSVRGWN